MLNCVNLFYRDEKIHVFGTMGILRVTFSTSRQLLSVSDLISNDSHPSKFTCFKLRWSASINTLAFDQFEYPKLRSSQPSISIGDINVDYLALEVWSAWLIQCPMSSTQSDSMSSNWDGRPRITLLHSTNSNIANQDLLNHQYQLEI